MKDLRQIIRTVVREYLNEDISKYDYNISYNEFEDFDKSVWRKLARNEQEREAIEYMLCYLNKNEQKLEKWQIGAIFWHIGQLYAFINDYDNAVKYMSKDEVNYSIDKDYQMGTIAFLKNDIDSLKRYYLNGKHSYLNKPILKRFIDYFDEPYKKTYLE